MLSRAETRRKLAAIIAGAVPELAAVYHYKAADIKSESPVVTIGSSGYLPQQIAANAYWTTYHFTLNVLTLYSDEGAGWTPEQAEDLNDQMVERIIDTLFAHRVTEWWNSIDIENRTFTDEVQIGGVTYIDEVIMVTMEMKP